MPVGRLNDPAGAWPPGAVDAAAVSAAIGCGAGAPDAGGAPLGPYIKAKALGGAASARVDG